MNGSNILKNYIPQTPKTKERTKRDEMMSFASMQVKKG